MQLVEKRTAGDDLRVFNRRRAIGLGAAAGLASLLGAVAAKHSDRRKKRDDGKNRKKDNKGKKGKNKKQQASGNGHDVVRVAKKYKGAKYKWGGASPKGFDCSGFTWYVYQKATGMDISRGVEEQWKRGKSVGKNDWKPGDVVFFKNTFERGLSHNGIYIGGDDFIHAENERTGVVISSLKSDYYSDHYAGARRLV
jgi:cell wall-associated NlpC family hydrolase